MSLYKKITIAFLAFGLLIFGLGELISWRLLSKNTLVQFPDITKNDRILIIAPHIDDEIIGSGGLIQQSLVGGAKIRVIYMTNGDNNIYSVVTEDKTLKVTPQEFIGLGEQRMQEGINAAQVVGLNSSNLDFLGYPDRGLSSMLSKYYSVPYTSKGTNVSYNPYRGTYKSKQSYTGANVVTDLEEIIGNFSPNIVIVSHPRDTHPDHSATYRFVEDALVDKNYKGEVFTYLVHYKTYPLDSTENGFLMPPKKLFTQSGWVGFNLTKDQESKKLVALRQNKSQLEFIAKFIIGFVKRNEIFEEMN